MFNRRYNGKISDIVHYIEFKKLDVFSVYKIHKMLKAELEKRRLIKNDLIDIMALKDNTNNLVKRIHKVKKKAEKKNKQYKVKYFIKELGEKI